MSEHPPTLLIVWHSQTGACEQAAACIAEAAARSEPGVRVRRLHADQASADDVLRADALVIVAAETLAALSGRIKDFFDRNYYLLLDRCNGRAFASVICAGSDGSAAERQLERIATGLRLRRVAEPVRLMMHAQSAQAILARKQLSAAQRGECEDLGALLASGLALRLF